MFVPVYLAALAAMLFYAFLPVMGAFVVRNQWRQFRKRVVEAARLPEIDASILIPSDAEASRYRAYGEVDAIGGQHELWISCAGAACVVDLRDAWVYVLTGRSGDDKIERRRWSGLPSVGSGTRVFVAGTAVHDGGRIVIRPADDESPLVILHDGDDTGVVRRSVRAGRHENEYWNPITQVSLALGVATMSGIVPLALSSRMPSLIGALTLTAAFSPILPLLPPGVVGFFAYRRFWRRARYCRARRDIEALEGGSAEGARNWCRRAYGATAASALAFAGALAANGWLTIALLRRYL